MAHRYKYLVAGMVIPLAAVTVLGMGWADHLPVPEDIDEEQRELVNKLNYMPEMTGHTESKYGDCTFSYVAGSTSPGTGGKVDMSIDCGVGYGGGGGGSNNQFFNLLMPDFENRLDRINWEHTGIEFCTIQTVNALL